MSYRMVKCWYCGYMIDPRRDELHTLYCSCRLCIKEAA